MPNPALSYSKHKDYDKLIERGAWTLPSFCGKYTHRMPGDEADYNFMLTYYLDTSFRYEESKEKKWIYIRLYGRDRRDIIVNQFLEFEGYIYFNAFEDEELLKIWAKLKL